MVPIERHSIIRYSYDDESQLHNSATPCRLTDTRLYIDDRIGWVTDNNVTLKNDKTEVELLHPLECPLPFLFFFIIISPFSDTVNHLGAALDSLPMSSTLSVPLSLNFVVSVPLVISLLLKLLLDWYLLSSFQIED